MGKYQVGMYDYLPVPQRKDSPPPEIRVQDFAVEQDAVSFARAQKDDYGVVCVKNESGQVILCFKDGQRCDSNRAERTAE